MMKRLFLLSLLHIVLLPLAAPAADAEGTIRPTAAASPATPLQALVSPKIRVLASGQCLLPLRKGYTIPTRELPSGFEVADRRYGRFAPAQAEWHEEGIVLHYNSAAPISVQQSQLIWRFQTSDKAQAGLQWQRKGSGSPQHGTCTTGRSYRTEPKLRAVPLGDFPAAGPVRIACVGDSITFGYGIQRTQDRYPEQLAELLGEHFEVRRFGNSGKTAGNVDPGRWFGLQREYREALDFQADIYICNLGINDTCDAWWQPERIYSDYDTLIRGFKGSQAATVVLWGKLAPDFRGPKGKKAYPGNVYSTHHYPQRDNGTARNRRQMEAIIKRLADEHKCPLLDAYTPLATHPELYSRDGLHPNAAGAKALADMTATWLKAAYSTAGTKASGADKSPRQH